MSSSTTLSRLLAETLRAHREELILQHRGVLLGAHEPLDRHPGMLRQRLALLPQPGQLGRGRVTDLARGVEGLGDGSPEAARRVEPGGQRRDLRDGRAGRAQKRPPHLLRDADRLPQRSHVVGAEDHPLLGGADHGLDFGGGQRGERVPGL
jgi:hypothetical protein